MRPLLPSQGMQAFAEQVSAHAASSFNITTSAESVDLQYSIALHDAVMLYAHAATTVLAETGNLNNAQAVSDAVRSTRFRGVGGSVVALDNKGDRIETFEVMSYVMVGAHGATGERIGVYNSTRREYNADKSAVLWPGNTLKVPVDVGGESHLNCSESCCLCARNTSCHLL